MKALSRKHYAMANRVSLRHVIFLAVLCCATLPKISSYAKKTGTGNHKKIPSKSIQQGRKAQENPTKSIYTDKGINKGKQLSFIENIGQVCDQHGDSRRDIDFKISAQSGLSIFIGKGEIHYQFSRQTPDIKTQPTNAGVAEDLAPIIYDDENIKSDQAKKEIEMYRMDVMLIGANINALAITSDQRAYFEQYFKPGVDKTKSSAHSFGKITYKNIYPNIDWVLYARNGKLKHEFKIHPGGKISDIRMRYAGATNLSADATGNLKAVCPLGTIVEDAPYSYDATEKKIESNYVISGSDITYAAADYVGELTIDPGLTWATYYGGGDDDRGYGIAIDDTANIYVTGLAQSTSNIATTGAFKSTKSGTDNDAILVKFSKDGARLWATYFGGSDNDHSNAIALDASGNIYIGGSTGSSTGIATSGSFHDTYGGSFDGFLAKFTRSGGLAWATYVGGDAADNVTAIAIDKNGSAYVTGQTQSSTGIATAGAFKTSFGTGGGDAFLTKFNTSGDVQWSTYYGNNGNESGGALATDTSDNIYLAGYTGSTAGIATSGALQTAFAGGIYDAFIVKFNSAGVQQFGTYFGGTGVENANAISISDSGYVYVAGNTASSSSIATTGAYQTTIGGSNDIYLLKLTGSGSMVWATYMGGTGSDGANSITIDATEHIYITGSSTSTTNVASANAYQQSSGGATDAILAKFDRLGNRSWSTYFGGSSVDIGRSVVVDKIGNIYLTGQVTSSTGIATPGAYQTALSGTGDVLVAKFYDQPPVITSVTPLVAMPGDTITITGANFNITPRRNLINFGAVKANVLTATTTSVTTLLPPGATFMPVSLLNKDNSLVGYSSYPLLPTFENSLFLKDTVHFSDKTDFAAGAGPQSVSLGDLDGDGKTDIAVANFSGNSISVYRNTSTSGNISAASFGTPVTFSTDAGPNIVVIVDIDGDGKNEMVTSNTGTMSFSVFKNNAVTGTINSSTFAARVNYNVGTAVKDLAFADFDKDGKTDIAVVSSGTNKVSIFKNRTIAGNIDNTSFAAKVDFNTSSAPYGLVVADLDGDTKPDLAFANQTSNTISVLRNACAYGVIDNSSFDSKVDYLVGTNPCFVTAVDIDGDGKPELIASNKSDATLSVLQNLSSPGGLFNSSFGSKIDFTTGDNPLKIESGDFNGDGLPDIAVVNEFSNTVSVLRNTSTTGTINSASLAEHVSFATGVAPRNLAVGDLDGDTKADIAIVNFSSDNLSILRNSSLLERPYIFSVLPNPAIPGNTVTISGANFSNTGTDNIVFFGGAKAIVNSASKSTLQVTLPDGTALMPITVANQQTARMAFSPLASMATFDNSSFVPALLNFDNKIDFNTGNTPTAPTVADIDLDGLPDMIVANKNSGTISVFRNTTSGSGAATFASKVDFAVGSLPANVTIADIDMDGRLDILCPNQGSNTVSVLINTSTPGAITSTSFATMFELATGHDPVSIAVGDFDGDGKPDITASNSGSNTFSVFRNAGSDNPIGPYSFEPKVDFATGANPATILATDLDLDGSTDVCVACTDANVITVFRNTSTTGTINIGSFATGINFSTGSGPQGLLAIDIDNDGKTDLVAANTSAHTISVLQNNSVSGTIDASLFAAKIDFATGTFPSCNITGGDADGDGKPDIMVANLTTNSVSVFRNTSTPGAMGPTTLAAKIDFNAGTSPAGVAVADLDGDDFPDIVVANGSTNKLSLLRNNPLRHITGTNTMCTGTSLTLSNGSTGGIWSSTNLSVATVGSGTGIVSGLSSGTANIVYSVNGGSTSVVVTVNAAADANFTINPNPVTPGTPSLFSNSGTGIASYLWIFGDGATANINNVSHTYAADGIYTASLTVTSTSGCISSATKLVTSGVPLSGINLDGLNDFIPIGAPLVGGMAYTKEAWINIPNTSGTRHITSSLGAPFWINNGILSAGQGGNNSVVTDPVVLPANTWTHVAVTYDASTTTMRLYRNGVEVAVNTSAPAYVAESMTIGAHTPASGYFQGSFDEIRLWSQARTFSEINGSMTCDVAQQANLVAYYRFNRGVPGGNNTAITSAFDYSGNNHCGSFINMAMNGSGSNFVSGVLATCNAITEPAITGDPFLCLSGTTALSVNVGGGVWSSANTTIANVNPATGLVTASATTTGTVVISYTTDSSCATTIIVTVGALPDNIGATTICLSQPVSSVILENPVAGGTWSSSTSKVAIHPVTGIAKGMSLGTTIISYKLNPDCYATTVVTVAGAVAAISGATQVCPGATTLFTNTTTGGSWQSSNESLATINSSGMLTGVSGGAVTVTYMVTLGCYKTKSLTVSPSLVPITGPDTICIGSQTPFSSGPSGGTWSSSNTSAATIHLTSGLVSGISTGTTNITYRVSTGCFLVKQLSIISSANSITGNTNICPGETVNLICTTPGGSWSSNNSSKVAIDGTTGAATGISSGSATISYIIGTGCFSTATQVVKTAPAPITGTTVICKSATSSLSTGPAGGVWASSNPSVASVNSSGLVAGVEEGTATITYTTTLGCATATEITISPVPVAIIGASSVCLGSSIQLACLPTGGTWSSSNTVKASVDLYEGIVSGMSLGTAYITYSFTSGCYKRVLINVNPLPAPITGNNVICEGTHVGLSSATVGGTWASSDPAILDVPLSSGVVTGTGAGVAQIFYKLSTGCIVKRQMTVNPNPSHLDGELELCLGIPASIFSSTPDGIWSSSNPVVASISPTGDIACLSIGTSTITYLLPTTGCKSIETITVNMMPSDITGPSVIETGSSSTLTCYPGGGTWISSDPTTVYSSGSSGSILGVHEGYATIFYQLPNSCLRSYLVTVIAPGSARSPLGTEDDRMMTSEFTVELVPNPTDGDFLVVTNQPAELSVFTIENRLVSTFKLEKANTAINLPEQLASGIYICHIVGKSGNEKVIRLVVKH